jgi:hypothetical protein
MKKLLGALAALAVLLGVGVGLAVFFGLLRDQGGGETAGEALAGGLYEQDVAEGRTCDDVMEIVNPSALSSLPPVVAVIEAEDIQFSIEIPNRRVASLMVASAKSGQPVAEKQALREVEDSIILYIALVREGFGVSEDEARKYLESEIHFSCGIAPQWLSKEQLVRAVQINNTTSRFVQQMDESSVRSGVGAALDQAIADRIAQARPTVKITEVALAAAGGLECTQADVKVACPSGLSTSEPTPSPAPPQVDQAMRSSSLLTRGEHLSRPVAPLPAHLDAGSSALAAGWTVAAPGIYTSTGTSVFSHTQAGSV